MRAPRSLAVSTASSVRSPTSSCRGCAARAGRIRCTLLGDLAPVPRTASPTSARVRDPLQRHRTTWVPVDARRRGDGCGRAEPVGLHDFASYCRPREGATTIRTLQTFGWTRDDDGVLVADVQADAFCHSMVRALVGACVGVGEGKLAADGRGARCATTAARSSAFKVMPARGLTLLEVGYPDDAELAIRARSRPGRCGRCDAGYAPTRRHGLPNSRPCSMK